MIDAAIAAASPVLGEAVEHAGDSSDALLESLANGDSVLRLLRYPPERAELRFVPHTDLGLASVYAAETHPSLEILDPERGFCPAGLAPDRWLLAAGEMLARKTAIPALTHRVGAVPIERFAVIVFLHPHADYVVGRSTSGHALTAGELSSTQRY
jgi:isopenicillin N synthase-like dioxygenase